jgi:5-methylcytosine-specific restriction endonuclease McrA
MKVIDRRTGKQCEFHPTEEFKRESSGFWNRRCRHPKLEVRRAVISNGGIQFRSQCLECGELIGSALSKTSVVSDVPPKDEDLPARYRTAREKEYEDLVQRHLEKQEQNDQQWWVDYGAYLNSLEWQHKRNRVFKRANGICEGCGERAATQIHHLNYKNVQNEFLFELVAICDPCHKRIHGDDLAEVRAELAFEWSEMHPCCACRWQDERKNRKWCGKFDIMSKLALSTELEPLK